MASRKKPPTYRRIWSTYRWNCKRKNIFFDLSVEQVEALASQDCFYCEAPPANNRAGLLYNGIDRKNNDQGYVVGNCVPCCHRCNSVKGDKLSFSEMRAVGRTLRVLDCAAKKQARKKI